MWEAATTLAPAAPPEPRPFVGRTAQLHRLRGALTAPGGGVVLVTGEPGMGRTSTIRRTLADLDMDRDQVVRVRPVPRGTPLMPLRTLSGPPFTAGWDDHAAVADAMMSRFNGRRPVVVADDAHLLDLASLLVLRDLRRRHGAVLLLTTPHSVPSPDPTDCLRFEPDARVVPLPALTPTEVAELLGAVLGCPVPESTASALCALTGGNPRRLHSLLARPGVAARILGLRRPDVTPQVSLDAPPGSGLPPAVARSAAAAHAEEPSPVGEVEVVHGVMADAWAALDLERVVEVGDLVSGFGTDCRIAAMHAAALLLRGRPQDADRVLRRAGTSTVAGTNCRMAAVRALVMAFGLGRPARARADLAAASARAGAFRDRLTAYLAWLCALDGAATEACRQLDTLGSSSSDPETAVMARTARALTALVTGRAVDAVRGLRRALAMVDQRHAELPWLPAHLQACLIEALLRAGRATEASAAAARLRADPTAFQVATTLPVTATPSAVGALSSTDRQRG